MTQPQAFTPRQRHILRYLARWGTIYGKPMTMELLRQKGLVEQCGSYDRLAMWRLTAAGKYLGLDKPRDD